MVPVVPGTPDTDVPVEQRTETCNVDAWWIMGRAPICHRHLGHPDAMGPEFREALIEELELQGHVPNESEARPWVEQHRYPQTPWLLFEGHPVRVRWEREVAR